MSSIPFVVAQVSSLPAEDHAQLRQCQAERHFPVVNAGLIRLTGHGPVVWIGDGGLLPEDVAVLQEAGFSPVFSRVLMQAYQQARRFSYVLLDEHQDLEQIMAPLDCFPAAANRLPA